MAAKNTVKVSHAYAVCIAPDEVAVHARSISGIYSFHETEAEALAEAREAITEDEDHHDTYVLKITHVLTWPKDVQVEPIVRKAR